MPSPFSLIFQAASNLTGGLVNDLTTAIIAIIALLFIMLGFTLLVELLERSILRRSIQSSFVSAENNLRAASQDVASLRGDEWDEDKFQLRMANIRLYEAERKYSSVYRRMNESDY